MRSLLGFHSVGVVVMWMGFSLSRLAVDFGDCLNRETKQIRVLLVVWRATVVESAAEGSLQAVDCDAHCR